MDHERWRAKCRVCLNTNLMKLFDWGIAMGDSYENLSFADCFKQCTHLEDAVDLPHLLCYSCAAELRACHAFIRRAQASDRIMRHYLEQHAAPHQEEFSEFECKDVPTDERSKQKNLRITANEINLSVANEDVPKREPFEFQACDEPTTTVLKRTSDMKRPPGLAVLTCEYCSQSFPENRLNSHIAREHKSETFLCHACPRTFKQKKALHVHALTHNDNRERNFKCELCGREFYTQTTYHNHTKTHEADRKPNYQCDQCSKSFFHKGSLTLHMHIHTGKTISCKICEKSFVRQVDLEIHLRSHSGDRPYKCTQCDKSFAQVGILNKHLRHHQGYRYKCNVCGKEYTHQSTLLSHRKEHTGLPLKCAICEKGFVKMSKMRRHISGVHKLATVDEIDNHIIKVKTKIHYRGRIVETT